VTYNSKIKNRNNGINTIPQDFDGYDVLQHSFRKTLNGSALASGLYLARVLFVKRETDPDAPYSYKILAHIPDLDQSIPEPDLYTNLKLENVNGRENFFYPMNSTIEEPTIGMTVHIMITDPYNRIGAYCGPIKGFTNSDIKANETPRTAPPPTPPSQSSERK